MHPTGMISCVLVKLNVPGSTKTYLLHRLQFFICTFSVFFQLPTRWLHHFLLPFYEAIGIRYTDQYLFHDYNQVPAGTCFGQSIIAGEY